MDGSVIAAWAGVGIIFVVNVAAIAFTYGRLSGKVDSLDQRCGRIEHQINGMLTSKSNPSEKPQQE